MIEISNYDKWLLLTRVIRSYPANRECNRIFWRWKVINSYIHNRVFGSHILETCAILNGSYKTYRQRHEGS